MIEWRLEFSKLFCWLNIHQVSQNFDFWLLLENLEWIFFYVIWTSKLPTFRVWRLKFCDMVYCQVIEYVGKSSWTCCILFVIFLYGIILRYNLKVYFGGILVGNLLHVWYTSATAVDVGKSWLDLFYIIWTITLHTFIVMRLNILCHFDDLMLIKYVCKLYKIHFLIELIAYFLYTKQVYELWTLFLYNL